MNVMDFNSIPAIATALGTVIASLGGAISYYYNGKQKAIQENAKLEMEKNSRIVRDLEASNKYLEGEIIKIRDISKEISQSYSVVVQRVESLETENKQLRQENVFLRDENSKLHAEISGMRIELAELKKNLR